MDKRSTDTSWQAMLEVRVCVNAFAHGIDGWQIINVHNGALMGTYRDRTFAVKQARRKYKKFIKLMEKSLMSIDSGT